MRATVTGATGFIGRHLVERLRSDGHAVTALVRPQRDSAALDAIGVEVVHGDVRDAPAVQRAVANAQVVFHLARARPHGVASGSEVQSVNVTGTKNVVQAAAGAGVGRLVHCSSSAVYGRSADRIPISEDLPLSPDSPYACSKAQGEEAARVAGGDRLAPVVARITPVLGPRCTSWRRVFESVAEHRLRLVGAGDNWHHPTDVSDIVDGLCLCADVPGVDGRTYNLAAPEPVRLRDMIALIADALGVATAPRALPSGPAHLYLKMSDFVCWVTGVGLPRAEGLSFLMGNRALDISRARAELGYAPRISVPDAIQRTAESLGLARK